MPSNKWLDRSQPQTLQTATMIMYFNAALAILFGGLLALGAPLLIGQIAAGWGIANEKKWGYWLGVGLTALWVAFIVLHLSPGAVIGLLVYGAQLALLLHPQSRSYYKIWFR